MAVILPPRSRSRRRRRAPLVPHGLGAIQELAFGQEAIPEPSAGQKALPAPPKRLALPAPPRLPVLPWPHWLPAKQLAMLWHSWLPFPRGPLPLHGPDLNFSTGFQAASWQSDVIVPPLYSSRSLMMKRWSGWSTRDWFASTTFFSVVSVKC